MARWGRGLLIGAAALLVIGGAAALVGWHLAQSYLHGPGPLPRTTVVELPRGSGVSAIATRLAAAGAIEHPLAFVALARALGKDRVLRAGEYALEPGMSPEAILAMEQKKIHPHDRILVRITATAGKSFLDRMIALVEGASRQRTPNEIALSLVLSAFTLIFLIVVAALWPMAANAEAYMGDYLGVQLADTIKGFKGIVAGEYDHLPEQAFYMVGTIDEAFEKAKKVA